MASGQYNKFFVNSWYYVLYCIHAVTISLGLMLLAVRLQTLLLNQTIVFWSITQYFVYWSCWKLVYCIIFGVGVYCGPSQGHYTQNNVMFLIVGLTWKIWLRHVAEFVLLVMLQYWHNKQPFSLRKYLFKTYTVCTTNQLHLCLYAPECVFITQILLKLLFITHFIYQCFSSF